MFGVIVIFLLLIVNSLVVFIHIFFYIRSTHSSFITNLQLLLNFSPLYEIMLNLKSDSSASFLLNEIFYIPICSHSFMLKSMLMMFKWIRIIIATSMNYVVGSIKLLLHIFQWRQSFIPFYRYSFPSFH